MTSETIDRPAALQLLSEIRTRVEQLADLLGPTDNRAGVGLSARDRARVDSVGEVAWRHLEFLDQHGGDMTVADSREIRRELYGDRVQSTANLFGRRGSGALLHRTTPYGTPIKDGHSVRLTDEGRRIATLWAQLHGHAIDGDLTPVVEPS